MEQAEYFSLILSILLILSNSSPSMTMKTKSSSQNSPQTSRRQFAKSIATTLVAAPLAASLAVQAQTPTKPKEATAPPSPQPSTAPQQTKPSPLAEAYAEVARVRFGEKLTPAQLEQIKKDLDGNARTADRLRAVKLKNGDEPDFIFKA